MLEHRIAATQRNDVLLHPQGGFVPEPCSDRQPSSRLDNDTLSLHIRLLQSSFSLLKEGLSRNEGRKASKHAS